MAQHAAHAGAFLLPATDRVLLRKGIVSSLCVLLVASVGTSVATGEERAFSVFPNPTQGLVEVRMQDQPLLQGRVVVRSLDGRELMEEVLQGNVVTLDLQDLAGGAYLLEFQGSGAMRGVHRIIKL